MTECSYHGSWSSTSAPNLSHPRLSWGDSNLHHPPSAEALSKWLWMSTSQSAMLCSWFLLFIFYFKTSNFVSGRLPLSWQINAPPPFMAGSHAGCCSWLWCSSLGSSPRSSQGDPLQLMHSFAPSVCCLWEWNQPLLQPQGGFCPSLFKSRLSNESSAGNSGWMFPNLALFTV